MNSTETGKNNNLIKKDTGLKWWFFLPFEQLAVAVLFGTMAPALWALYDLSRGNMTRAVLVFGVWLVLFTWLSFVLHKRRKAHFLFSFFGATIVLVGAWYLLKGVK